MDKHKLESELKALSGIEDLNLEENELGFKLTVEGKSIILKKEDYAEFEELTAIGLNPEAEFALLIFSTI